jgi:non-ribosomal peptide synthase protein (TIGR01720 family)
VIVGLESHGRQDISETIDTSRTVGWFTTIYPVLLEIGDDGNTDELIKSVKEQLRSVPDKGVGYGVLKYINKDILFQGQQPWDLVFNYLGQLNNAVNGKWLTQAYEPKGSGVSDENAISEKLSVTSWIQSGELTIRWSYSEKHYTLETISNLGSSYVSNLELLITHCLEIQKAGGMIFTPSDYGLASEITYNELDRFLNDDDENILSF